MGTWTVSHNRAANSTYEKISSISSLQHCAPQEIKHSWEENNPGVITTSSLYSIARFFFFFVYLSNLLCLKLNIPPDNLFGWASQHISGASQVLLLKLDECDLNLQKRKSYYDILIRLRNCQATLHGQLPTCGDLISASLPTHICNINKPAHQFFS